MKYKFIYFDVAGTLLYKRNLFNKITAVLSRQGINIDKRDLVIRHKLLTEVVKFPKKTDKQFYDFFNSELLYSLGIVPSEELTNSIYNNCKNLRWNKFEDVDVLKKINVPIGIISNWDNTLTVKVKENVNFDFKYIYCSEDDEAKPDISFFRKAFDATGVAYQNIAYVGDSIKLDIEPAKRLGAESILLDREVVYKNYNSVKIRSLRELLDL